MGLFNIFKKKKSSLKDNVIKSNISNVENEIVNKVTGTLKEILERELSAGNEICETYEGDWPQEGSVMVFLSKPFKTPIQHDLPHIEYALVNDPHYWKAQYFDTTTNVYLCCKFDGPNFDPL